MLPPFDRLFVPVAGAKPTGERPLFSSGNADIDDLPMPPRITQAPILAGLGVPLDRRTQSLALKSVSRYNPEIGQAPQKVIPYHFMSKYGDVAPRYAKGNFKPGYYIQQKTF